MVSADVRRSIFHWDMNIFGPTRILCDKRTYDLLVTCLNDLQHIWASKTTAKLWHQVDRWTKATSRHQPRLLGRPHICDGWHRLDEALPLLCILPCAQNFSCAWNFAQLPNAGRGHTYPRTGPSGHGCKIGRWLGAAQEGRQFEGGLNGSIFIRWTFSGSVLPLQWSPRLGSD